ncbi:hypothetical protein QFC24_007109 [Naganishia onofrii]|uniref:Uncharacterized protein n=1 Tax=Naganishia onofrii TaxID=1851511 RepID=A0ACC2WSQ8_9TREE|nr:hypothetical protein QFC24_007109 [Naganishia onofrii]
MSDSPSQSRPWLVRKRQKDTIHDKKALPKPSYIPTIGKQRNRIAEGAILTKSRQRFEKSLVLAKEAYLADNEDKMTVKIVDESEDTGAWREVATRNKRPLSSVVTEDGVKEKLERDIIGFPEADSVPGSGKTSLIHALASACDLDIYVISLSTAGPAGSVVVMEDIDASMPEDSILNRQTDDDTESDLDEEEDDESESSNKRRDRANKGANGASGVTLSGLPNAIDGVAGSEGRICRADIHVEFKNASKSMCRDLFKVFFPITGEYPIKYARASDVPSNLSAHKEEVIPQLTEEDVDNLADRFAATFPERGIPPAQIQGMLMLHRLYPGEALDAAPAWIEAKRQETADAERKK